MARLLELRDILTCVYVCNWLEKTLANSNYNSLIRLYRMLAEAALTHYDVGKARVSLLSYRRNAVFRVYATPRPAMVAIAEPLDEDEAEEGDEDGDGGEPLEDIAKPAAPYAHEKAYYVLRLCDVNTASEEMIRSEAQWLLAMHQGGDKRTPALSVPEPVAGRDGSYVLRIQIEGVDLSCLCLLLRWMPGRQVDSGLSPTLFERVGTMQARLHQFVRYFTPPNGFARPQQDWLHMLSTGLFALTANEHYPLQFLDAADRSLLTQAARYAYAAIEALPKDGTSFGLVHADFQQAHYVFHRGQVSAIGFDRCCYDYFLSDCAVTLGGVAEREDATDLAKAYWRGYVRVLPLPQNVSEGIEVFAIAHILQQLRLMAMSPTCALESDEFMQYLTAHRERLQRFVSLRG